MDTNTPSARTRCSPTSASRASPNPTSPWSGTAAPSFSASVREENEFVIRIRLLLALVVLLVLGGFLPGSAAPPPPVADPNVSLDADDAYLPSVLKTLAEKGGLNIITGPGVTAGRLSIHMKDVPIDQAVNLVVRAAGLAYERIGNSVLVADARSLEKETGLSSYVVELKYADAAEVKEALKRITEDVEMH